MAPIVYFEPVPLAERPRFRRVECSNTSMGLGLVGASPLFGEGWMWPMSALLPGSRPGISYNATAQVIVTRTGVF